MVLHVDVFADNAGQVLAGLLGHLVKFVECGIALGSNLVLLVALREFAPAFSRASRAVSGLLSFGSGFASGSFTGFSGWP
jgi:hypothetical protein